MISAEAGPIIAYGQMAMLGSGPGAGIPGSNPDRAPSLFDQGVLLLDPRIGYRNGVAAIDNGTQGPVAAIGIHPIVLDQAPSAVSVSNIAAAQNATNGTALTLTAGGAGITAMSAALTIPQTGSVVPGGTLVIDGLPAVLVFGGNGGILAPDPRTQIARAVSITGSASATGGAFLVAGYDLYGNPQTERITAAAGAMTTNGKKGWKFITSVTPQFTDAHNYSVGDADIYELPVRADEFFATDIAWANALITSGINFTAADTTNPATSTTGSVRGTFATPTASNGTNKLQVFVTPTPWNVTSVVGLFGVPPA